jgi:hypothetical protein
MLTETTLIPVTLAFQPNALGFGILVASSIRVTRPNPPRIVIGESYLDFLLDQPPHMVLPIRCSVQSSLPVSCYLLHNMIAKTRFARVERDRVTSPGCTGVSELPPIAASARY